MSNEDQDLERSRLAAIIEFSDDAIIGKDLQGIVRSWNKGAERIFGYKVNEMVGQSILKLIPGDRHEEEILILEKIKLGEPVEHFETQRLTKDGRLVDISVTASPIKDASGEIVGASKIARDITEWKRAQRQIAEQAALIDNARDAIIVCDLQDRIQFWNKGAERIYGWPKEKAIGCNIANLLYINAQSFKEEQAQVLTNNEWSGDRQHISRDRQVLTIESRWTLIKDEEGEPKSLLAINTDITERRKVEAQFMRAQRMESIGTLAGGIAHDLNNILAPIMLSIDILKTICDDPDGLDILETIETSAKRGSDIVRQVLSFARGLDGDRVKIQPTYLINDLDHILKNTLPKDIRLQSLIPRDIWSILGDPTQVHQVLLNLCINARDAMPNGGTLQIGIENSELDSQYATMNPQAKAGRYVVISVTDSGTGIPPELLEKIFEPFFTTKEVSKGTGLGLSTVSAIVKSHGGFLNVYSEIGRGSTFKLYLPAAEEGDKDSDGFSTATLPRGKGETILVVDDESSILRITSQTLEAFGYRVLTASNGAEGVAVYARNSQLINLVLTDMMMPIMDGPATIHALLSISPTLKIIAASGLNANGSVAKASNAGIKHFLEKPYTAATLLNKIRYFLDEEPESGTAVARSD